MHLMARIMQQSRDYVDRRGLIETADSSRLINRSIAHLRDKCRCNRPLYHLESQRLLAHAFRCDDNRDKAYRDQEKAHDRLRFARTGIAH